MSVPAHRARLHELRLERCLTQEAMAAQAGISRFTLNRIEKGGRGSILTRRAIASFLDEPVRELFPELFQSPTPC